MKKKVVVGLSGGVDSSVSAALLLEQGYDVIGIFMRNWNDESVVINNECPWIDDSNDALAVAEKLEIPFHVLDLSVKYKERIVDYMFREYEAGRTPNPDVLCNREIKFDVFLDAAMSVGADYVATGHYCQKEVFRDALGKDIFQLKAGADTNKDQSYFLCQVSQQQLSKALFPIGHLQKADVRELAKKYDLITAEKKDSQGLCFIGKVKLPVFLQQQLKPKVGDVIELPDDKVLFSYPNQEIHSLCQNYNYHPSMGKKIGSHQGIQFYTIGQRKGLGIGGTELPLFVLHKDAESNTLYVGKGENHAAMARKGLFVRKDETHWVREDKKLYNGDSMRVKARIRYRQELENATLYQYPDGLYIVFDQPMKSIASGQFVAWYEGNETLGSGVIY